ncbi:MAG TPA: transcription elongation factor GreA [Firmicutes bacterium]|nr:transcription elongation factor GreA [Bacillota bacterium]HHY97699.1 transcription elongation factor GreA [Bacillota bacterium]
MGDKEVLLTLDGIKRLEQELDYLKTVRRREVANRIKEAKEFGDISENSEYEDAKNEQAFVEGRIIQLEKLLRNARVIDESNGESDAVTLGSRVTVRGLDGEEAKEYTIVGSAEADPARLRISNESPVGRALLGRKAGSIVEVEVPMGKLELEILKVVH